MTRPLVIDDIARIQIARVLKYADEHTYTLAQVKDLVLGNDLYAVSDDPGFTCDIPMGYRCVYSVEEHPAGLTRHLSVSVPVRGLLPACEAVYTLAKEFGFLTAEAESSIFAFVDDAGHGYQAVNLMQVITPMHEPASRSL